MNIQIYGTLGGEADPTQLAAAYDACEEKGATIPQEKTLANLADCIETIPGQIVIPPEAGTLSSLVVGTLPKVAYVEDDPLDLSGMVILGNYSNGGQYDVTPNCTITANNPVLYTDTKIVVSLDGVTLNIPITVAGKPVKAPASTYALYHVDSSLESETQGASPITIGEGYYADYITGRFSSGIKMRGNGRLTLPVSNDSWDVYKLSSHTIEMWVCYKGTANIQYSSIFTNSGFKILRGSTTDLFFSSKGTNNEYITLNNTLSDSGGTYTYYHALPSGYFPKNVWVHLAVTIDNGKGYVFVNGNLISTCTLKANSLYTDIQFVVTDNNSFAMDEIMFCNEVKYVADFEPPHGPYYIEE